jgi:hypothetical protein
MVDLIYNEKGHITNFDDFCINASTEDFKALVLKNNPGMDGRKVNGLVKMLQHMKLEKVNQRLIQEQRIKERLKAKEITVKEFKGCGGVCFCGKRGLKESTVLVFSDKVTLMDYKGEKVTGTTFNLGNECINTYKLMLYY